MKKLQWSEVALGFCTVIGSTYEYSVARADPATIQEQERSKLEEIQEQIRKLQQESTSIEDKIAREQDRTGKLTKELLSENAVGCFARQKVQTFEVFINGTHENPVPMAITSEKLIEKDNPRQFIFSFGNGLKYTHSDEEQQSLFVINGSSIISGFVGRTIADIEYISLDKGGIGIESIQNCWRTMFGKDCEWRNSEKNIYRLDSIAIKVNGEEFYRMDGINHTFKQGSLSWSDKNIRMNPAFRKLMKRTDCPAQ